jgi:hypothetical protein
VNVQVGGYSLGAIIALIVLILCILALGARAIGVLADRQIPEWAIIGLIGGVAFARLT